VNPSANVTHSESVIADDSPFDLRPKAGSETGAAALCLHGLTGTPYELRSVAESLVARGIRARGIWMAGHGGSTDELRQSTREEWVEHARSELLGLREQYSRVFLVGVSMGGLVSLRLAETSPVDGLVVVGVPLVLAPPIPQILPLIRLFASGRQKRGADIREPAARARHPGAPVMPFDSVRELIALQKETIPDLSKVSAPILVAHGELDGTARPRDARRIHAEVGSQEKELFLLARSGHVATVDYDGPALARAAADFLARR
jgi:carboxylesterase